MKFLLLSLLLTSHVICQQPADVGPQDRVANQPGKDADVAPHIAGLTNAECSRITGTALKICSNVRSRSKVADRANCNDAICKSACCHAANVCKKSNFLSLTTQECISSRMQHDVGGCCIVGKAEGATMVYAGGAVGAAIIISGLYFILSMGSKKQVIKAEKPIDGDSSEEEKLYQTKMPHMEVNQLIATDGDDVFWED
ncbi:acid phosphatase [Babesia caballi]|uniref:Acid phosphatase n=1 Tax=Babesia caballi TaxID=5871 RepID=A0AAV4LN94_BABCB|nr:acid phosphatase [Babesia caballi]